MGSPLDSMARESSLVSTEPPSEMIDYRRQLVMLVVAVAVAVGLAALAPPDWEQGAGNTVLTFRGETVTEGEIQLGSTEPAVFQGEAQGLAFTLRYPRGLPVEGQIDASIAVADEVGPVRRDVGGFELLIETSEIGAELIPIVGFDDEEQVLQAVRRPPQDSAVVLGLLGFVVVLWVSEAIPLFVTSLLIPVALVFSGVGGAAEATAPFFNPIIVLFFAGFLMAEAMKRSGLDHRIAVSITASSRRGARTLFGAMIGLTAVMSMFMSNTAATAVLVPIAIAVSEPLHELGFRKALVLGIAYAATIGGVGSAIGTPANQLAIEFLGEFGDRSISFAEWFVFGLPMVVLFIPVMGWYLWKTSDVRIDRELFREVARVAQAERQRLGSPSRDQLVVLGVFAVVALGWLTQTWHGIHPGLVALAGAVGLYVLRRLEPEDLGGISWASLLTFGGGLTLGLFIVQTGTSDYVATRLAGLSETPELVTLFVVALITLLLTTVASNTASAAILIPLAIPLASVLGMDPTLLVLIVAIASSIDFALVIGTPPTMIAYSTGLYRAGQIFRKGVALDLAGIVLLVVAVSRIWEALGVL